MSQLESDWNAAGDTRTARTREFEALSAQIDYRSGAMALCLSADDGWQDASRRLGGAFAAKGNGGNRAGEE